MGKDFSPKTSRLYHARKFKGDPVWGQSDNGTIEPEMLEMAVAMIKFLDASSHLWFKYFDIFWVEKGLNLMAIENNLCEISKYLRVLKDFGRLKNRYDAGTGGSFTKPVWQKYSGRKRKIDQIHLKERIQREQDSSDVKIKTIVDIFRNKMGSNVVTKSRRKVNKIKDLQTMFDKEDDDELKEEEVSPSKNS